ncbi:MAG: HDIG domain-containing protein [Anaerolineales bacterium]|nr:HDIG domain-containing protein [Anaerolineales bacterium]
MLTQTVTLEQGEMIIRAGDVASAEQAEALREMSTLQYEWDLWALLQATLFSVTLLIVVIASLYRLYPQVLRSYSQLGLLLVVTVLWLLAAKFMVVNHPWLPFLYPMGALVILIGVLCDLRVAVVFALAFAMILLYLSLGNAPLVAYALLGSLAGSLIVGRGERLNTFLWAAVAIGLVNAVMIAAFWVPFTGASTPSPVAMALISGLNGVLSAAIALIGYFVLGNLFDITTPLQLAELSRPTHPLLRQLLLKASGTYHHTILVSNMAERAAAAIGADALLVRVGAYYHDIGKTVRPYFFAENIVDGSSPHEKLDPLTSAQIIISHVKDGVDLAQKYRLPSRIQDFIREHHGQSLVKYFYLQALRHAATGEEIDEAEFRYPGPNPQSKETTILMLADTCEAAVRAVRPATREDLEALVDRLIDERVASGELENSNLTFAELQTVKNVFLQVLQGVHHPRIVYPEPVKAGETTGNVATDMNAAPEPAPQERTARGGVEEAATGRAEINAPVNMAAEG